jgi:BON domain
VRRLIADVEDLIRRVGKDSAITTAIKTKLAADHPGSLAHLKVDTDKDGVVWLSGTTRTQEEADRAVEIARGTNGVVRVKNEIVVRPDKYQPSERHAAGRLNAAPCQRG